METTPALITYAPLLAIGVISFGIMVTLLIYALKLAFHIGGLSNQVNQLSESVSEVKQDVADVRKDMDSGFRQLRQDMDTGFQKMREETDGSIRQLRQDMDSGFQQMRDEMRDNTDRILRAIQYHRHDTDGNVVFTVPQDGD